MTKTQIKYSELTQLPLKVIMKDDTNSVGLYIKTPHRGEVIIDYKQESHPMFGASNSYDRQIEDVIKEIKKLERDSVMFLFNEWIGKNNFQ